MVVTPTLEQSLGCIIKSFPLLMIHAGNSLIVRYGMCPSGSLYDGMVNDRVSFMYMAPKEVGIGIVKFGGALVIFKLN